VTIDEIGNKVLFAERSSSSHARKTSLVEDNKKRVDLITKLK
jgi:hypothetical protein